MQNVQNWESFVEGTYCSEDERVSSTLLESYSTPGCINSTELSRCNFLPVLAFSRIYTQFLFMSPTLMLAYKARLHLVIRAFPQPWCD